LIFRHSITGSSGLSRNIEKNPSAGRALRGFRQKRGTRQCHLGGEKSRSGRRVRSRPHVICVRPSASQPCFSLRRAWALEFSPKLPLGPRPNFSIELLSFQSENVRFLATAKMSKATSGALVAWGSSILQLRPAASRRSKLEPFLLGQLRLIYAKKMISQS
jgi:hypothetical protein